MVAYYNEIDKGAAAWLRELIKAGHIAPGDVDERDIRDVNPDDLRAYTQCHFFAGIGGWSLALRNAGWDDGRPVWTGSCPCQPFSAAGKRGGLADERHLWPHWFHLIEQCRPPVVFGEQVASKDGLGWFDLVSADLEGSGYAVGAADLCVAGVGGPHIRQRLWFVGMADAAVEGFQVGRAGPRGAPGSVEQPERLRVAGGLGDDDDDAGLEGQRGGYSAEIRRVGTTGPAAEASQPRGLADAELPGGSSRRARGVGAQAEQADGGGASGVDAGICGLAAQASGPGPVNGFWRDADWLFCRDGKWRPVEPGTFPLAHGIPGRVGLLRGYGNAISPEAAEAFIRAADEARGHLQLASGMTEDIFG